jgi:SAM-dependent methyltransferase
MIFQKRDWFRLLSDRWAVVPFGQSERASTRDLMNLSDVELIQIYDDVLRRDTIVDFGHRGWFHTLYKDLMIGKDILDIGTGLGISSIQFLSWGNRVTFADLVPSNLELVQRIIKLLGIDGDAKFLLIENFDDLNLVNDLDILFSGGSLHHAPKEFLAPEYQILQSKIRSGGRWLQLAYPKTRWVREGSPKYENWGTFTDGPDTPYAMPIDASFVQSMIMPRESRVILDYEFHNSDFNWIDLELL